MKLDVVAMSTIIVDLQRSGKSGVIHRFKKKIERKAEISNLRHLN